MEKVYVKIDRATGNVLQTKTFKDIQRVFNKPKVWIERVQEELPTFDKETHKAIRTITQPDLSDLGVDVPPATKRIQGYNIVALSAQELQDKLDEKVSSTNEQLFNILERLMVIIATKPDAPPKREDFSDSDWDVINARLALKGEDEV